jgi:hypothetical protein
MGDSVIPITSPGGIMVTVRKKAVVWQAMQYLGPTDHSTEFYLFMDAAPDLLITATWAGVYKLQLRTDTGNIEKASVKDWILKDGNSNYKIVKETKLATDWEIVP